MDDQSKGLRFIPVILLLSALSPYVFLHRKTSHMKPLTLLPFVALVVACTGAGIAPDSNAPIAPEAPFVFEYQAIPGIAIEGEPITAASMTDRKSVV